MRRVESCTKTKILLVTASLLWLMFIFLNSAFDGDKSSDMSGWALELVQSVLDFLSIPLTLSEHFVRKAAHFTEYFILGALLVPTVYVCLNKKKLAMAAGSALALSYAAACFDEFFIQARVPGRCASVTDSFIDLSGAAAAVLIFCVAAIIFCKKKKTER